MGLIQDALASEIQPACAGDPSSLLMPDHALDALGSALNGDASRIAGRILSVRSYLAWIGQHPPLRPQAAGVRLHERVGAEWLAMVRAYADAFGATVPIHAQEASARAQSHLDNISTVLEAYQAHQAALSASDTQTPKEVAERSLVGQMQRIGATTYEQLVDAGERRAHQLLGVSGTGTVGLQILWLESESWSLFDPVAFERKVQSAYRFWQAHEATLDVVHDDGVLDDLANCEAELFADLWTFHLLTDNAQTLRRQQSAAVRLAAELLEGPGGFLARVILSVAGLRSAPYEKLRRQNATELVRAVHARLEEVPMLGGLDAELRIAADHKQVTYGASGIEYVARDVQYSKSTEELIDSVFEALESVEAEIWALKAWLAQRGLGGDAPDLFEAIGMTPLDLAQAVLPHIFGESVTVDVSGSAVHVSFAREPKPTMPPLAIVAALGPVLEEVDAFQLELPDEGTVSVYSGPTSLIRLGFPDGDVERFVYWLRLGLSCEKNGEPLWTPAALHKTVAGQVVTILRSDSTDAIPKIRQLIAVAQEIGDEDLESRLRKAIRAIRLDRPEPEVLLPLMPYAAFEGGPPKY